MALNDSFWKAEQGRLVAILRPRLEQMAVEASKQAADKAGIGFNPNLANAHAARWARDYTDTLLKQLGTTSTTGIGEILSTWIETPGATYGQLQQSLIHYGEIRAQAIAVTETTRAYAEGEEMTYKQEGITHWTWRTNRDELVCKICGPLNNQVRKIGDEFGKDRKGNAITKPPAHVNCRCWVAPVLAPNKERQAVFKPADLPVMPVLAASVSQAEKENQPTLEPVVWKPSMTRAEAERWAENSAIKETVSHVTYARNADNIKKVGFELNRSGAGRVWGDGVYVGLDDSASQFYEKWYSAEKSEMLEIKINVQKVLGVDVSSIPDNEYTTRYQFLAAQITNGSQRYNDIVQEIEAQNKNVMKEAYALFPISNDRSIPESLENRRNREKFVNSKYTTTVANNALMQLLRENGYDALKISDNKFRAWVGGNQINIFDQKNVTVVDDGQN